MAAPSERLDGLRREISAVGRVADSLTEEITALRQRLDALAKGGRIPGAKFKFGRWEVPESAPVLVYNPGKPKKGEKPFPRVNR